MHSAPTPHPLHVRVHLQTHKFSKLLLRLLRGGVLGGPWGWRALPRPTPSFSALRPRRHVWPQHPLRTLATGDRFEAAVRVCEEDVRRISSAQGGVGGGSVNMRVVRALSDMGVTYLGQKRLQDVSKI